MIAGNSAPSGFLPRRRRQVPFPLHSECLFQEAHLSYCKNGRALRMAAGILWRRAAEGISVRARRDTKGLVIHGPGKAVQAAKVFCKVTVVVV